MRIALLLYLSIFMSNLSIVFNSIFKPHQLTYSLYYVSGEDIFPTIAELPEWKPDFKKYPRPSSLKHLAPGLDPLGILFQLFNFIASCSFLITYYYDKEEDSSFILLLTTCKGYYFINN